MSGEPRDITGFLYEIGLLKRYPRTGWSLAGVPDARDADLAAQHRQRDQAPRGQCGLQRPGGSGGGTANSTAANGG